MNNYENQILATYPVLLNVGEGNVIKTNQPRSSIADWGEDIVTNDKMSSLFARMPVVILREMNEDIIMNINFLVMTMAVVRRRCRYVYATIVIMINF